MEQRKPQRGGIKSKEILKTLAINTTEAEVEQLATIIANKLRHSDKALIKGIGYFEVKKNKREEYHDISKKEYVPAPEQVLVFKMSHLFKGRIKAKLSKKSL